MKCRNCINRYSAASNQPVHGGSSAPGGFFIAGLISAAVMVGLSSADVAVWKWLALGMAVFSAVQVFVGLGQLQGSRKGGALQRRTVPAL